MCHSFPGRVGDVAGAARGLASGLLQGVLGLTRPVPGNFVGLGCRSCGQAGAGPESDEINVLPQLKCT